jgi:hypothetical protein
MYSFFKEFYEWRELFFLFVKIIYNFSSPFVDEANIQQMLPKVASEKGKKWPEWF